MKFQILCLANQSWLRDKEGALIQFERGDEAATRAKELIKEDPNGAKWMVRKITDSDDWRKRELKRFEDGIYKKLPWSEKSWAVLDHVADHFAHISRKSPGKVAFTSNVIDGERDLQTAMRAGRYLKKFYGGILLGSQIESEAANFAAKYERNQILWALSSDEIVDIYTSTYNTGSGSCMSDPEHTWERTGKVHPARVYGTGEFAVAYLSDDGHITARGLVYLPKKTYSRCYGDYYRLERMLQEAGYTPEPPIGAKLLLLTNADKQVICPYVDKGHQSGGGQLGVLIEDGHLVIRRGGYEADYETGLIKLRYDQKTKTIITPISYDDEECDEDEDRTSCENCGDICDDDNVEVFSSRTRSRIWCQDCADNHSVRCRDFHNHHVEQDCAVSMEGGEYHWTCWGFEDRGGYCEYSDENVPGEILRDVTTRHGDIQRWSSWTLDNNATMCAVSHEFYANDAIVELPDGRRVGYDTEEGQEAEEFPYHSKHPNQLSIPFSDPPSTSADADIES